MSYVSMSKANEEKRRTKNKRQKAFMAKSRPFGAVEGAGCPPPGIA